MKTPVLQALALVISLLTVSGCQKEGKNPLLRNPSAGVTSVTMAIPQIDTSDSPENRIFVSVTDNSSNFVTDLQLGNFNIIEGGTPGVPYDVARVSDPLYICIVIDRSGSMLGGPTTAANNAAVALVNAMGASDQAAYISFSDVVNIVLDFTTDKTALTNAINAGVASGGTAYYDATSAGAGLLSSRNGRRMLVVLTDGADTASDSTPDGCIRDVNAKGISANMVGLGGGVDTATMNTIAQGTGGAAYFSASGNDLAAIFLGIFNQYNNLVYIKYRRRGVGDVNLYLNYGSLTAQATKPL